MIFLRLLSRCSCLLGLLALAVLAAAVGVLVLTSGGVDLLGLVGGAPPTPGTAPEVPRIPGEIIGPAPLNSLLAKRPLFQGVPLPQEIARQPAVLTTNLLLAGLMTLTFGAVSKILETLRASHQVGFDRLAERLGVGSLRRLISGGTGWVVRRGLIGLPFMLLVFALYGILFTFLEAGTNLLSPDGVQLALVLAVSVGLVSLAGDLARRIVARAGERRRYGLYPATLLFALLTTILSRLAGLAPGIMFGVPGGADADVNAQEGTARGPGLGLAVVTPVLVLVFGALGWLGTGALAEYGTRTLDADTLAFVGPVAQFGQTFGLALFVIAVQTAFYTLLPFAASPGGRLFRRSIPAWAAAFAPVAFIFAHTLLNPFGNFLAALETANFRVLAVLLGALILVTFGLWGYFRLLAPLFAPRPQPDLQPRWYIGPPSIPPERITFTPPPPPPPEKGAKSLPLPPGAALPAVPSQGANEAAEDTKKTRPVAPPADEPTGQPQQAEVPSPGEEAASVPTPARRWRPDTAYEDLFPPPTPEEAAEIEADTSLMQAKPPEPPGSPPMPEPEAEPPEAETPFQVQSTDLFIPPDEETPDDDGAPRSLPL